MVAAFDCDRVHELAAEFGYTRCQFDDHQGLAAFRRTDTEDGTPEIVRVWWRTRTVETQLKHPGQVAHSLYRKNVPNYTVLRTHLRLPARRSRVPAQPGEEHALSGVQEAVPRRRRRGVALRRRALPELPRRRKSAARRV